MDAAPTTNYGTIHAVVTGRAIKANGLKLNIMTEIGYQVSKELLDYPEKREEIIARLDDAADVLFEVDINDDGTIDHSDLHAWVPSFDKPKLRVDYNSKIHPIERKIYNANDIYEDAYNLIYPNTRPVADAGEDLSIKFGESVTLDGSGSYDSDGEIVKYTWQKGGTVLCQGVTPICVIDGLQAGSHTFSLVVQDDTGVSSVDYINVTVNNEAILLGSINTSGTLLDVKLSPDGTIAYLADDASGLLVVDVSDPKTPRVIGQYNTPGYARNLVLSLDGTTVYIADTYSGLQIVDVNDPFKPFLLSSYDTDGYAYDITLSADGTMVYIADGSKGLKIIDVSNATTPHLVGNIKDFGRYGYAISIKLSADGMHAFVIDGEFGLQIIDISDPSSPYVISTFRNGWMVDIMLSPNETLAYISSYPSFSIIDLSDVTSPSVLGSLNIGSFSGILVNNNIVFASNGRNGVTFIDVSNSTAPKVLSTFDTSGSVINTTLSADGNTLFVADSDSGLQILDVSAFNH